MLKALELTGFKSFADKTRFEFPPGITVVVGPNGSGKSNIVDAIKWVLGEQSAKSLRGRDMADVIFKGNGSGGRKMMNTAEATIVFDNADQRLAIDAPEVHVTRRVYRSGEGEYLINRQPCRLKDVRDLFRGTGVGTDAYSLIEQGKVDQLLQASPRDRRAIFEEAAGISRFKAKKIETQRRLERVEQNLLRLTDIVDEVENRLRSVRSQAAKARRYREHSDRLQQLRTQVGLTDWRHLSQRLRAYEAEMTRLRDDVEGAAAQGESIEARVLELELEGDATAERARECESRLSRKREQIAAAESNIDAARSHGRDQEEQLARCRRQLATLMGRAGDMHDRLRETVDALSRLEIAHHEEGTRGAENEGTLSEMISRLGTLRSATEARRTNYVDLTRRAVNLANRVAQFELQLAAGHAALRRAQERLDELAQSLAAGLRQLAELRASESQLESRVAQQHGQLDAGQRELAESRRVLARRQEELAILRGRYSAIRERATVLEELERKQEGLTAGVRQLVALSRQDAHGLGGEVEGLVADLLHTDVETARMVDAALGERSQFIVLCGDRLLTQLRSGQTALTGRVGIVRCDEPAPGMAGSSQESRSGERPVQLDGLPGVLGRVDRLVQSEPRFRPLLSRILGRTWAVERIDVALALRESQGHGLRFVTRSGELVESDGSIVLGPPRSAAGLVSRRAELRLLEQELPVVGRQMADAQQEIGQLQDNIDQQDQQLRSDEEQHRELSAALAEQRISTRTCQQRCEQLNKEHQTATAERRGGEADVVSATAALAAARDELAVAESEVAEVEQRIRSDEGELERLDAARRDFDRQTTASRIELATSQQQLAVLRSQRLQFEETQRERARAIEEAQARLNSCREQLRQSDRSILSATSQLAEYYLEKERSGREAAELLAARERLGVERNEHAEQLQQTRKRIRGLQEQLHQQELLAGEVRHERQALAQRLREDYGIELAEFQQADDPQHEREAVEQEIAELRRKISNIGAVNMEALNELEELEMRFGSLSGQHRDLTQAKEALERIIHKINADSRRLFSETLEAIRVNFQSLYRKAFGGGKADLVLEEGQDILEAGVDIIATPPGKPTFNNSLLSGGEKALTAVSLLLAIFQYRPSPFCVLDEVDAPFDEANIGRFVDVLHGFLGWTKFVIVTHSKKTMTAATTLYGVTMQESGVSKQVSVRFDDVSEDGHISEEALRRDQPQTRDDDERGAA